MSAKLIPFPPSRIVRRPPKPKRKPKKPTR
jgi:hypothetical protein